MLQVQKNMTEPMITVQNLGGTGGATFTIIDNASGANWKFKATLNGGFNIRDHANLLDVITLNQVVLVLQFISGIQTTLVLAHRRPKIQHLLTWHQQQKDCYLTE